MESLAVKYRPQTLEEIVSQESVTKILTRQVSEGKIKNCYLFTGASGCGKTTTARALARLINGNSNGVIEVDGASNNGVDNIRALITSASERAIGAEYKIIIMDECHMITVQGWNAFLKTLEEPPKYTIFMFCTTNPEKIPITVLNRLQRFNLQRIPANKIEERLNFICKSELFTNYKEACAYISKISNGQMRDAITALDKCASYDTDLSIDKVLFALGNFSYDMFFDLLNAIIDDNEGAVLQIINSIYYDGKDLNQFIISFTAFILDVTKYLIFGNFDVLQIPTSYQSALDNVIKIENVQLYYNYLIDMLYKLREAVKFDTDIKSTSEILFLKMARNIE